MEEKQNLFRKKSSNILLGIILLVVVINTIQVYSLSETFKSDSEEITGNAIEQETERNAPEEPTVIQVSADDDPFIGEEDAPVTIIEFSDFQCPYCQRFYLQTLPSIMENYVETGKVKIVFRDFPLGFHQYAHLASQAAQCANDQGKFWEYHDQIFENQQSLSETNLKTWAQDLGLDTEEFNDCLDSEKYADEVDKDIADGAAAGVSGTPSFFVNGIQITGAQPYSVFQEAIEAALEET